MRALCSVPTQLGGCSPLQLSYLTEAKSQSSLSNDCAGISQAMLLSLLFPCSQSCLWGWPAERVSKNSLNLPLGTQITLVSVKFLSTPPLQLTLLQERPQYQMSAISSVAAGSAECVSSWFMGHWTHFAYVKMLVMMLEETVQRPSAQFSQSVPHKAELWRKAGRICDGGACLHTFMKFSLV